MPTAQEIWWREDQGGSNPNQVSRMSGMDESAVVLKRAEVVLVGPQADIAIGAHCEERGFLDAEEIRCDGFKISDLGGQVAMGTEGDGSFKQRRAGGEFLQGGVEFRERRTVCGGAGQEHQGMAGAVSKLVQSARRSVRPVDGNCIR